MPKNIDKAALAAHCHEVQTGLGITDAPDFENLTEVGMAVRLALHIRGLTSVKYSTLKMVASHYLQIPSPAIKGIVELLAKIEFIKIQSEGKTIKSVIPNVPYYETMYETMGEYAIDTGFNEAEELTLDMLVRLSKSPEHKDALLSKTGAENKLFERTIQLGTEGHYLKHHRCRGRDIVLSPTYFSENYDLYADLVANKGANQVKKILTLIEKSQGYPLSVIEQTKSLNGNPLSDQEIAMLVRLAQDGAVRPPSIQTQHAGENFFLFTPTPTGSALSPTKKEIYEKAMAIVAAIRQGQFLPHHYAIRSPSAILNKLCTEKKLSSSTEANHQYAKLVHLRIARLVKGPGSWAQLHVIDTEENMEALRMAYSLVDSGSVSGSEVDDNARKALQQPHEYIESIVASGKLQQRQAVSLSDEQQLEMETLYQQ